jgi:branched-chain amino acid aminotransferase
VVSVSLNWARKYINNIRNYGPTLQYYVDVQKQGYQHILWLYKENVTEVGVMNFFVYWINEKGEKELITCPTDGLILPGVMRDSIISLAKELGVKVNERYYNINEVLKAINEGRVLEAFGSGTAAIICPIKNIAYKGKVIKYIILGLCTEATREQEHWRIGRKVI